MVDRKLGRGLDFFLSPSSRGVKPAAAPNQQSNAPAPAGPAPTSGPATGKDVVAEPRPAVSAPVETVPGTQLRQIEVARIGPNPRQPRTGIHDSDLSELTESIRVSGVLQPILVRAVGERFEIVAGERRWRAAQAAGLQEVPVVVREVSDEESAVFALVENLQREDLNAMEKAQAFRELQKQLRASQEEVARRVGLDRSTVANFVRLLDLPLEVQAYVSRGTLSMGHARALLGIKDPAVQTALAEDAIRRALSVRALEELVRSQQSTTPSSSQPRKQERARAKAAWLKEIEETLTETLGTEATVRYGAKTSVIQITCAGREEFERIYARLKDC